MPRRVGRYTLIAAIASGGMGSVVLARLAGAGGFQRLYAIKLLHGELADDTRFVDMLMDEARIAARVHHPNVVPILEIDRDPSHGFYVVMDYVEGVTLHELLSLGPAPPQVVVRVLLDALQGLHAAHTLRDDADRPMHVVHRDVSPQNLLVGVDGVARVTDFGVAKAADRLQQTMDGQAKGKLAYMPPEQALGHEIDARSDVFALGVVLWEALARRRLFRRATDALTYRAVTTETAPPLRSLVPTVPIALETVCTRALERDPARRFPTARAMARALEDAARTSGLLGDVEDVASLVREGFAGTLAARREAIRAASGIVVDDDPTVLDTLPVLPDATTDRDADVGDDDAATTRLDERDRVAALAMRAARNTAQARGTPRASAREEEERGPEASGERGPRRSARRRAGVVGAGAGVVGVVIAVVIAVVRGWGR